MKRLDSKTCPVTAAGQGFGRASSLAMQAAGGAVVASDIIESALGELTEAGVQTMVSDVTDAVAGTTKAAVI